MGTDSTIRAASLSPSASARWRLADYLELTKYRMNLLVVATTAVGCYMAAGTSPDFSALLHAVIGTALTAAAAGALNQVVERVPDARMARTAHRPVAAGRISPGEGLGFGLGLAAMGLTYLAAMVNLLTAGLALLTLAIYVLVYTPLKRKTSLNTLVGAVTGALPPVMGYTAMQGRISHEAMVLFAILYFWQLPHFLAIAVLYADEYRAAGFRMLPVLDPGLRVTGRQMVLYTAALALATTLPAVVGMAGLAYLAGAIALGAELLWCAAALAWRAGQADRATRRHLARRLFIASILYLPLLLALMMLDKR